MGACPWILLDHCFQFFLQTGLSFFCEQDSEINVRETSEKTCEDYEILRLLHLVDLALHQLITPIWTYCASSWKKQAPTFIVVLFIKSSRYYKNICLQHIVAIFFISRHGADKDGARFVSRPCLKLASLVFWLVLHEWSLKITKEWIIGKKLKTRARAKTTCAICFVIFFANCWLSIN